MARWLPGWLLIPGRWACVLLLVLVAGCRPQAGGPGAHGETVRALGAATTTSSTVPSGWDAELDAWVAPPTGWVADPLKRTSRSAHRVWVSPDGATAYGVIRFSLPMPVGTDFALWGFLGEMRKKEGEATLLAKRYDAKLYGEGGLRFVAEGGMYRLRANMVVVGFKGWCVYAGTLRAREEDPAGVATAEDAREGTRVGE